MVKAPAQEYTIAEYVGRYFDIDGVRLAYPTSFRDGSCVLAMCLVDAALAQEKIADSGFKVAEIVPGKAVMNIIAVHYTDTDCGVYEEMAFNFLVEPQRPAWWQRIAYLGTGLSLLKGNVPSFTWRLPVSSNLACECGRQMWGFPKTIEDLRYDTPEFDGVPGSRCSWYKDGELVLALECPGGGKRVAKTIAPPVYSLIDGQACVSYLQQDYEQVAYHRKRAWIHLGQHPLADELRALGLEQQPLLAVSNGRLRFSMSAPRLIDED